MRILPLLLVGGFGSVAYAQVAPAAVDVTGAYSSTWGAMTLQQSGTHVTGAYAYHDGHIDGTLDGNTLRFAWTEDDGAGRGELVRASDGTFVGSWGNGNDDANGGLWRLAPASAGSMFAPPLASVASTTEASADSASDAGPHAGSWSLELDMPIDATFASGSALMGVGGVEVGIGKRLSDHWYVGGTGGVEMLVGMSDYNNAPGKRLRAGGEARYIFGTGTGSASVNCGPSFPVPITGWLQARAGAETLNGGSSFGTYGDLAIGMNWWLGHMQVGMYLQAGMSIEPTSAYGTPAATDDDGTTGTAAIAEPPSSTGGNTTATYVGLGWRIAFG
ncbi:MAG TPA: hypothetical protein VGG74_33080 [Kofleriaceae bacterium]|jgi:hypothetical protein